MNQTDSSKYFQVLHAGKWEGVAELTRSLSVHDASSVPDEFIVTQETTHDDAVRTMNGNMPSNLPTVVIRKAKITLRWKRIRTDFLLNLFSALNLGYDIKNESQSLRVRYLDFTTNLGSVGQYGAGLREITAYVSPNLTASLTWDASGNAWWQNFEISFIEK